MGEETERKPSGNLPKLICVIATLITIATIYLGYRFHNPFIIIIGFFPAAIYEAIRTEGIFTKIGSAIIAILVILEILAIKGIIRVNLADVTGQGSLYFSGYNLPLGDVIFIFPAAAAIISFILLLRTWGIFTKWLAILLLASSIALLFMVSREGFFELLKTQYYYF